MRVEITKKVTKKELLKAWGRLTVDAPDTWITDADGERHRYVYCLRSLRDRDILAEESAHELRILGMIEAIEGYLI